MGLGLKVGSERGSLVRSIRVLGALGQLLLVGFGEALTAKVVIPLLGESLMLRVQVGKLNILAAYDVPAPLLHAYVVVSVVVGVPSESGQQSTLVGRRANRMSNLEDETLYQVS